MSNLLHKYRQQMQHEHGWDVELTCSDCGHTARPVYHGWKPVSAMRFGQSPTIYAILSCPQCHKNMQAEAEAKLVELFQLESIPPQNKSLLMQSVLLFAGMPLLLLAMIGWGILAGWWDAKAFISLAILPGLVAPLALLQNYRVARLRNQCDCGEPRYLFMGLLGRSYCYRCSTCGRLLRLRD
ncbi:MAG: hypothetical protein KatS3mg105_3086 [Gemmatales bacterium]|nr:MAG: hypothetical protein KatS3mg105_3086 [Gemmatales bacterium]